ncbi:Imm49 family immunity protein [Nocardiopsis alba]|uniref:Imm49 family immunity protein n=1 Tax=Nocardiopsis alba TaxID=53437 RepID=UPI0033B44298
MSGARAFRAFRERLVLLSPPFERALVEHLTRHRELMETDENATAASLLPVGVIALAALAVQTHGWELNITSDYLLQVLLHAPEVSAL